MMDNHFKSPKGPPEGETRRLGFADTWVFSWNEISVLRGDRTPCAANGDTCKADGRVGRAQKRRDISQTNQVRDRGEETEGC